MAPSRAFKAQLAADNWSASFERAAASTFSVGLFGRLDRMEDFEHDI
jgi:hypothetical protein